MYYGCLILVCFLVSKAHSRCPHSPADRFREKIEPYQEKPFFDQSNFREQQSPGENCKTRDFAPADGNSQRYFGQDTGSSLQGTNPEQFDGIGNAGLQEKQLESSFQHGSDYWDSRGPVSSQPDFRNNNFGGSTLGSNLGAAIPDSNPDTSLPNYGHNENLPPKHNFDDVNRGSTFCKKFGGSPYLERASDIPGFDGGAQQYTVSDIGGSAPEGNFGTNFNTFQDSQSGFVQRSPNLGFEGGKKFEFDEGRQSSSTFNDNRQDFTFGGDEPFSSVDEPFSSGDELFSSGDEPFSSGDESFSSGDEPFSTSSGAALSSSEGVLSSNGGVRSSSEGFANFKGNSDYFEFDKFRSFGFGESSPVILPGNFDLNPDDNFHVDGCSDDKDCSDLPNDESPDSNLKGLIYYDKKTGIDFAADYGFQPCSSGKDPKDEDSLISKPCEKSPPKKKISKKILKLLKGNFVRKFFGDKLKRIPFSIWHYFPRHKSFPRSPFEKIFRSFPFNGMSRRVRRRCRRPQYFTFSRSGRRTTISSCGGVHMCGTF